MRLTNAWLLVLAAATSSSPIVSGFQLSRSYLSSPRVASSSIKVAATSDAVAEAASPPTSTPTNNNDEQQHSTMTYADINALAFRALQRQCKSLGLSAAGTTAALRGRLLEHYSLSREVTTKAVETPTATASEIEVSFMSKV